MEAGFSVDVLEGGAVGASLQLGRAVWMGIVKVLNAFDPLDAVARSYSGVEGLKVDALEVHCVGDGALAVWSIIQDLFDSHPDCAAKLQAGADGPALEHVYTNSGLQLTFPPMVSPTPSVASATPHALSVASAPPTTTSPKP